jgi:mannose-6-phosphate isomerase
LLTIPLKFEAIVKPKVWGGCRLSRPVRPATDGGGAVGEFWDISEYERDVTRVADGPLKGRTLRDLMIAYGPALVGEASFASGGGRFPLLLKRIDARATLSVQVHPSEEAIRRLGLTGRGKMEAWYVLHAEPGAVVFHGLEEGVDGERFRRLIAEDRVERALRCFPVREGDMVLCPPGTVHAIGAGLTLLEVQEASDTTFRVFDWHRTAHGGDSRPLHVNEALQVIRFDAQPPRWAEPQAVPGALWPRESLVACDKFAIERWQVKGHVDVLRRADDPAQCAIITVVAGGGVVSAGGESVTLGLGESAMIPAAVPAWKLRASPKITALYVTIPG